MSGPESGSAVGIPEGGATANRIASAVIRFPGVKERRASLRLLDSPDVERQLAIDPWRNGSCRDERCASVAAALNLSGQ